MSRLAQLLRGAWIGLSAPRYVARLWNQARQDEETALRVRELARLRWGIEIPEHDLEGLCARSVHPASETLRGLEHELQARYDHEAGRMLYWLKALGLDAQLAEPGGAP